MIRITIGVVVIILSLPALFANDPCRFDFPAYGVIDLSSLGRTNGTAAYADINSTGAHKFKVSYNPCRPFSEGDCHNVSVCRLALNGSHAITLGTQESAVWYPFYNYRIGDTPYITYSKGSTKVVVTLQCTTEDVNDFQFFGLFQPNNYVFQLTHKCACWNACSNTSSTAITSNNLNRSHMA